MAVVINGTTGITTPTETVSGLATAGSLQVGGVATNLQPLVSGTAVTSTSGTSIDFTSIPSWVKRITVMFNGVSTNGVSSIQVQLGAGSVTTTGYASNGFYGAASSGVVSGTTGMLATASGSASATFTGIMQICLQATNNWVSSSTLFRSDGQVQVCNAVLAIGGTLDRIRITTFNGTDTFDAGSINILYE